jgi:hypothetical protein
MSERTRFPVRTVLLRLWLVAVLVIGGLVWFGASVLAAPAMQDVLEPSTHDLWIAALAILTVIATSLLNQLPPHFSDLHKRIIAAIVAGVFATVGVYYQGALDSGDWGRTWLVIFMAATSIYVILVKPVASFMRSNP